MKDEQINTGPKTKGEVGVTDRGETKCMETGRKKEISNTLNSDLEPNGKSGSQLTVSTP